MPDVLVAGKDVILRARIYGDGAWKPVEIVVDGGVVAGVRGVGMPGASGPDVSLRPDANLVDMSDYYLTPGLVDCHVHLAMDAHSLQDAVKGWPDEAGTAVRVASRLGAYVRAGVVLVRDGGDAAGIGLAARRMVGEEAIIGPRVVACGRALYKKGRYGDFLGPGIGSLDEGRAQLDGAAKDTTHVKICQSGIVSFKRFGEVGPAQFELDELTRLIGYAHDKGLSVMVHASGAEAVDIAVRAGADTVEHGYFITRETIRLMAERGTVWVPTFSPLANLISRPELLYAGASLDVIRRAVDDHKGKIAHAYGAGVRLAVGTDAGAVGVEHGASVYDEIEHMVSAGIARHDVLRMAVEEGRRVLGDAGAHRDGYLNSWRPGDFFSGVFFRRDPLLCPISMADIEATCLPPAII